MRSSPHRNPLEILTPGNYARSIADPYGGLQLARSVHRAFAESKLTVVLMLRADKVVAPLETPQPKGPESATRRAFPALNLRPRRTIFHASVTRL